MSKGGPQPFPPSNKTPAAMVVYELSLSLWSQEQRLNDGESAQISFTDESGKTYPLTHARPVTDTILMIETYIREREWRLHFVPCSPLIFTAEVVKEGSEAKPRSVGLLPNQ